MAQVEAFPVPADLTGQIAALILNRRLCAELPWASDEARFADAHAKRLLSAALATRATDLAGLDWKLGELVALLEAQGTAMIVEAEFARSARDDLAALGAALSSMGRIGSEPPGAGAGFSFEGIQSFTFDGHPIRVVVQGGEPWFVAADVCRALGIKNATQAAATLDDDERSMLNIGRAGEANVISESGLYTLILRCRDAVRAGTLPHRFRKWVTGEVLPAIRRAGAYAPPAPQPAPACPLLRERPYFPRAINLTPEQAAERARRAARKRRRQALAVA